MKMELSFVAMVKQSDFVCEVGLSAQAGKKRKILNWYLQGDSDCLIKTQHLASVKNV